MGTHSPPLHLASLNFFLARDCDAQRNGSLGKKRRKAGQLCGNKFRMLKFSRIKYSTSRHTRLVDIIAQITSQNA